jgi:hypothetical protein
MEALITALDIRVTGITVGNGEAAISITTGLSTT